MLLGNNIKLFMHLVNVSKSSVKPQRMTTREEIKAYGDMNRQLEEEDKSFLHQIVTKDAEFTRTNQLTKDGFNQLYVTANKNFQLALGTVCERGRKEVIERLKSGKDKTAAVEEYLTCVESTRQKAAQRAQQAN